MTTTNWDRWESRAKQMTVAELCYAIRDCSEAAKNGDAIDRMYPGTSDAGGRYRDELSVYHTELQRRRGVK